MRGEFIKVWPINLESDPDGRLGLYLAFQEESAARKEYMRLLKVFNELRRYGTPSDEDTGSGLCARLSLIPKPNRDRTKTEP